MPSYDNIDWCEYLNYITSKEVSITEVVNYLSEKKQLLEYATLHLQNDFPVYNNVMLIYSDDFWPELLIGEKINCLQKTFEILFNYSKNLLVNFDIYREKYIKGDNSQIVDYLSKLPDYSEYLSLIGYVLDAKSNKWQIHDHILTNEKRIILQCLSMCSCVCHDYWINCTKYLSLTAFHKHRVSIEKLLKENKCEYCEFELNPDTLQCSVCNIEIDDMTFFSQWRDDLMDQSLNKTNNNAKNKPRFYSLETDRLNNGKSDINQNQYEEHLVRSDMVNDTWICECSFVNPISHLNCTVCMRQNKTTSKNDYSNRDMNIPEKNHNKVDEPVRIDLSFDSVQSKPLEIDGWNCSFCTQKNPINAYNCITCTKTKSEFTDIKKFIPISKSFKIDDYDTMQMKQYTNKSESIIGGIDNYGHYAIDDRDKDKLLQNGKDNDNDFTNFPCWTYVVRLNLFIQSLCAYLRNLISY